MQYYFNFCILYLVVFNENNVLEIFELNLINQSIIKNVLLENIDIVESIILLYNLR